MRTIKNRFIALLVVFTSVVSFLPVGFGGQTANAAATSVANTIRVRVSNATTELPSRTNSTSNEKIYTSEEPIENTNKKTGVELTVKDVHRTLSDIINEVQADPTKSKTVTAITKQRVQIDSINEVAISTSSDGTSIDDTGILTEMGISITDLDGTNDANGEAMYGKRLLNLPLGINKIEYQVILTNRTVTYTAPVKDATTGEVIVAAKLDQGTDVEEKNASSSNFTIEHGTKYVTKKIQTLQIKSYVGTTSDFTADDQISNDKNNKKPFLYSEEISADTDMPLRYNVTVPDSTFMLKYIMNISELDLANANIYRNGKKDTSIYVNSGSLQGSLESMSGSSLIIIKTGGNDQTISKSYAIEIKYSALSSDKDYSLNDAGITKYDFNETDSVQAYIGKKFTVAQDTTGSFKTYNGTIYIDQKANMISIDPDLISSKSKVAYKVTNNYVESGTAGKSIENAILKSDGKKYIDFNRGSSNELQIDVYPGTGGNITDSSKILARYLLKVNQITTTDTFTTDLKIEKSNNSDAIAPYLTQPGVKESIIDKFTTDRRTYDLYYATGSPVKVTFTGTRSSKNEYFKIWTSTDRNSTSTTEAAASVNNKLGSDLKRETSLNIDLNKAEKMVVQAYYDEFEYVTDSVTNVKTVKKDANGNPIYMTYPLGEQYIFYIPSNSSTTGTSTETSDNALLNSLKLSGYTLIDSAGNKVFSSDKLDYVATVAKEDTSAKITAIPQDDNIQSMIATVDSADGTYYLVSGKLDEIPLNASGKTTITIVVTAQNGTTTKKYTVVIKNNTQGSNVNLKNVILSPGEYNFDSKNDVTKVRVDQNVTNIKVTPIAEQSKSVVSVNAQAFSESPISISLKGTQKTEINIKVTSEDGTNSKTYTLEVYRVDSGDWITDTSGVDPNEKDQFYDEYSNSWVDSTKYEQWGTINGKPVYFDKKGKQVKEAWINTGGKMYYLNNLGYRASGWKIDDANEKTYYLDPKTGEMKKQWMNLDNKWYYLGLYGVMQKGWLNLNNKWYYFTPNGQMVVNQTLYIDDEVCNFGQDGAKY